MAMGTASRVHMSDFCSVQSGLLVQMDDFPCLYDYDTSVVTRYMIGVVG